jgi:hypothetical protein
LTFSDLEKSKTGGTPLSPGYRQYVFHPVASRISMPARSRSALAGFAVTSRTAERASPSHDEASAATAAAFDANVSTAPTAAVETHCRNVDAIMNDRLDDMDINDH